MKNTRLFLMPLVLSLVMGLAGCKPTPNNSSSEDIHEDPDGYVDVLPENNEGNIIQCFNWKYSDIKDNLSGFANSGFKVIQTSPVQQPKNGGPSWFMFYQPVSFAIGTNSPLGTKDELRELCEEAEEYGIAIICDIVFNHLANIGDGVLEEDGTPKVSPEVERFEQYIYEHRNDAVNPTFHHNKNAQGSGAITQVYSYGDLPDLNTANPYVQERSLALLKECIDVGVDGFRFDAAKHIETPNDPQYASDFWPNVLEPAKEYYHEKTNKELIAYGEVLNDVDGGRKLSDYTQFMKATDNSYIADIASASVGGNASKAANAKYAKRTDPSNLVTWVESHDTYVEASTHTSNKKTARQYAVIGTRKDSVAMFLARPNNTFEVGVMADFFYEKEEIAVTNRFHNRFVGFDEEQSAQDSVYINQRFNDTTNGAMLVNFNGAGEFELTLSHLDGVYYNQVTSERVIVKNNKATVTFDDTGIVVLTKSLHELRPTITLSERNGAYVDSLDITIKVKNATEAKVTMRAGDQQQVTTFTDNKTITLGSLVDENNMVYVDIEVKNNEFTIERHLHYRKVSIIPGYLNVVNLNPNYLTDYNIYYWAWGGGSNGIWLHDYEVRDGVLLFDFSNKPYTGFLLAIFDKDYEIPNVNVWDNNFIKQTGDIDTKASFYDATGF